MAGAENKVGSHQKESAEGKGFLAWLDARLPVINAFEKHMSKYYAPKNFNFWYVFGVLSMVVLANQLLTGIWLTMNFNTSAEGAFASVEYIMRRFRVLHRRLPAHVPCADVRLLPEAA